MSKDTHTHKFTKGEIDMKKYFAVIALGMLLLSMSAVSVAVASSEQVAEPVLIAEKIVSDGYYQDALYPDVEREVLPLYVDPGYSYLRLQPGESDEMTVVVYNSGEEAISVEPRLVPQVFSDNVLDAEWVTFSPANVEMKSGDKQEFTIKVSVPKDAELAHYTANVLFSGLEGDVTSLYPGNNGALEVSVNVWLPPNVQIFNSYLSDRVEAGGEYEYTIKLKNIADKDISINPVFEVNEDNWYGYRSQVSIDEKDVTITAPSVIKAGEKAVVKVKVNIPADAEGSLNGAINLNIADRTINEWSQKVNMNFDVWQQPEDPFTTTFVAMTDDPISIKVFSTDHNYGSSSTSSVTPSFDVVLRNADGQVKTVLTSTSFSGSVSLSQQSPIYYGLAMDEAVSSSFKEAPVEEEDQLNVYQQGTTRYTELYSADGAAGKWTLEIMPHNTENFEYAINIGPVN